MSAGIAGSSTGAGDRLHDHGTERGQVVRGSTGDEVAIGTTACSTTVAPALRRSVRILENEVRVRPDTTSASSSVHGPWHIDATGFPVPTNSLTRPTAA